MLNERSWKNEGTTVGHMRTDVRENVEMHAGEKEDIVEVASAHQTKNSDIRENISESLQAIDADANNDKKIEKKRKTKHRRAKLVGKIIGLLVLVGIGFLVYKAWQFGSRVFQGNIFGFFSQQELKMDSMGRSNVLILGSTDDMPGRDGADLTDSMMVLSVDQKKKNAYMYSIPRDLWVNYGKACMPGYAGKINAYYACAGDGSGKEADIKRMDETRKLIGSVFDMDIQYVVHVNTVVIRDSVNALGGITVDVKGGEGAPGVLDSTFDDMCQERRNLCPRGHFVDFRNGPNNMNGDQAMAFSQARGMTAPTYGLGQSNFDREKNQQLVLTALKNKATSSGTMTDFGKVIGLMDAMGDNLRTNIDANEIRTILALGAEIKPEDIHRLSFIEEDNMLMTTGMVGAQSVVIPSAGNGNFGEIRKFLRNTIYATPITKEAAKVTVLNGSGKVGAARAEADKLEKLGMDIVFVGDAPEGNYGKFKVYQVAPSGEKSATRQKLEEQLSVKVSDGTPPFPLSVQTDFVIVVGE